MNKHDATTQLDNFIPVILAGGSGTRFWPRSRRTRAKQVLALDGDQTMIQETFKRLLPSASIQQTWVVANDGLAGAVQEQLPNLPADQLVCEPCARNTAAACGLMAYILRRRDPHTVLGIFPSDHVVTDSARFTEVLAAGTALARTRGNIVVLGAPPSSPETGYGYIEEGLSCWQASNSNVPVCHVTRFTEKPDYETALRFVESKQYSWNSGMFLWSADTLCDALEEHAPKLAYLLQMIAAEHGTPLFDSVFAELYPQCQNISIDYAVLEPRSQKGLDSHIFCMPADFGWNDLGSWSALYHHRRTAGGHAKGCNVVESKTSRNIEASSNYVYAPGRHVALLGVDNLVVVLTDDAVLVTRQDKSQDVGKIVKHLTQDGFLQLT